MLAKMVLARGLATRGTPHSYSLVGEKISWVKISSASQRSWESRRAPLTAVPSLGSVSVKSRTVVPVSSSRSDSQNLKIDSNVAGFNLMVIDRSLKSLR